MKPAELTRTTVAVALVLAAVLVVASVLLMPDFGDGHADFLRAIAADQGSATISSVTFIAAQLFCVIGLLGVAHLLRSHVPVLATVGAVLVILGGFGHAVYGGVNLVMLSMAQESAAIDVHVAVLQRVESGVTIPFMAAGLLGTVLGFIVLGVAVWRGGLGPRWVGPAMIVWVVLEFVGSNFSEWASFASGALYALVFGALALAVWQSSISHWQTAAEVGADTGRRSEHVGV